MTIGYARIERGLGLALLAGAAALAQPALESQAVVDIMRHAPACLGGGAAPLGPATLLGHCALCWAAGAAALAGALLSWRGFARRA
jgi:hypothetical protein